MKKLLAIALIGFSVSGCAMLQGLDAGAQSILSGGVSLTAPANVSIKSEYTVETLYSAAMKTYREYLRFPTCLPGTHITLTSLCRDAATVASLTAVRRNIVEPAMQKARTAQRDGGINAAQAISDVRDAIIAWQSSMPLTGGN